VQVITLLITSLHLASLRALTLTVVLRDKMKTYREDGRGLTEAEPHRGRVPH